MNGGRRLEENWIVQSLSHALEVWNGKLNEIWELLTQRPETFRGGEIWKVMVSVHGALQAIAYALLVLFFLAGVLKTAGSLAELKRPELAIRLFLRFILSKAAVTYGLEGMMSLFSILQGILSSILESSGLRNPSPFTLPEELTHAVEETGFLLQVPLWAVTLIGTLMIWILSLVMILNVYGRFFKIYLYTALAPLPLASFAGEPTQGIGKSFLRSYAGVCLEGAVILLGCVIFSVFAQSPPAVDPSVAAVTMVWSYLGELIFNMLILVGTIKMADKVVREMMFS